MYSTILRLEEKCRYGNILSLNSLCKNCLVTSCMFVPCLITFMSVVVVVVVAVVTCAQLCPACFAHVWSQLQVLLL